MRITNTMLINNMMDNMAKNLERMDKYQNQMATGKKISVPSDDPVVAARALKLRTDVSVVEQYKKNTKDAQSWIEATETALVNMGDIYQRARELAVQGSNGTLTPDDKQKIAEEVGQLKKQLINLSNSTYAGRYIFSGYKTDTKLLRDDGFFNIEISKNENINYEIGIDDEININVPGSILFNSRVDVGTIPAKSKLVQDFDDFVNALGTRATYNGSSPVPMTGPVPFDVTGYNDLNVIIDGVSHPVDLTGASATPPPMTLDQIVAKINVDIGASGTASIVDGKIKITSSSVGTSSSVAVSAASTAHVNELFGMVPRAVNGTSFAQGAITGSRNLNEPVFAYTSVPFDATGYNDIHISFDGNPPVTVNLGNNTAGLVPAPAVTAMTTAQIVAEISADIAGSGTASFEDGRIVIRSNTVGIASSVAVSATSTAHLYDLFGKTPMAVQGTGTTQGVLTCSQYMFEEPPVFNVKIDGINRTVNIFDNSAGSDVVDPEAMTLGQIVQEINKDISEYGSASIVDGKLRITSGSGGEGSIVEITAKDESILSALFGTDPVIKTGGDSSTHGTYTAGVDLSSPSFTYDTTVHNTMSVEIDGVSKVVSLTDNKAGAVPPPVITAMTTAQIVAEINADIGTAGTASLVDGKFIRITSATWGEGSKVKISSSDTTLLADLFGRGTAAPPVILPGTNGFSSEITDIIGVIDSHMSNLQVVRADIGARTSRVDLTSDRLDGDILNFTRLMSDNEDVDMAETIMKLKSEENVYKSSLAGGARIIQPSLVDFLR